MRSFINGATGGLGRALAEQCAQQGHDLILQGRHSEDLSVLGADLELVFGVKVELICGDLRSPETLKRSIESCCRGDSPVTLAFAAVISIEGDDGHLDDDDVDNLFSVNVSSTIKMIQGCLPHLKHRSSRIIGFGSVATCRARGSNMVYTSSKVALEAYFDALMHRCSDEALAIHFVRLGYLKTRNSAWLSTPLPIACPKTVAAKVIKARPRSRKKETFPVFWLGIIFILKAMPWFLFKRLRF